MKIYTETALRHFEFWGGACSTVDRLTDAEIDEIEEYLEEIFPEGMEETVINDFFWFETDAIAQMLGYVDYEEMYSIRNEAWIEENFK